MVGPAGVGCGGHGVRAAGAGCGGGRGVPWGAASGGHGVRRRARRAAAGAYPGACPNVNPNPGLNCASSPANFVDTTPRRRITLDKLLLGAGVTGAAAILLSSSEGHRSAGDSISWPHSPVPGVPLDRMTGGSGCPVALRAARWRRTSSSRPGTDWGGAAGTEKAAVKVGQNWSMLCE